MPFFPGLAGNRKYGRIIDRKTQTDSHCAAQKRCFLRRHSHDRKTKLPLAAFVADNATVRGHVTAGKGSSIYFGAVIRSESDTTAIGEDTNIQDNCVLHTDKGFPITIGRGCTIGHAAILHGCTIGDNTLIGMGAILLNGARVGRDCIVGAGALVPQGMEIPDGSLAFGSPAKVRRAMTTEEIESNRAAAAFYCREAEEYAE